MPIAKKRGDGLERRPPVGTARERETSADYAALYRRERRTLSQSRIVRPLTAFNRGSTPRCGCAGRMATSSRTWPGKESRARCRPCRPSRRTSGRCPSGRLGPPWRPWRCRGRVWPVKRCLRFLVLTAARSGEARGATWAEVDFEAKEWRIPGERMKGGREHRVPLSDAAVAVLGRARGLDDGSGLVFPSPLRPARPLSPMTLTKILRDRGLADRATVHGFRSAFRDWCAETGKPREIAEAALAHTVGGVEGPISALTCTRVGACSWTSGPRS